MHAPHHASKHIAAVAIAFTTTFTLLRGGLPWESPLSSSHGPFSPDSTRATPHPGQSSPMTACQCQISKTKKKDPCCHRRIVGVHKGGHVLVSQFREKFFPKVNSVFVRSNSAQTKMLFNETIDYREVFIARDLYEMLISGYLYHKSGRECWLGMYGEPLMEHDQQENTLIGGWDQVLQKSHSFTAINNRSLCQYLAEESPEVGIRVYSEYALHRWYRPFFNLIAHRTSRQGTSRSIFLDLHQLSNETTRHSLLLMLRDFFVLQNKTLHEPNNNARNRQHESTTHDHGHDTSHDPMLRLKLKDLIRQVDQTYLNGWINQHHQWPPQRPAPSS